MGGDRDRHLMLAVFPTRHCLIIEQRTSCKKDTWTLITLVLGRPENFGPLEKLRMGKTYPERQIWNSRPKLLGFLRNEFVRPVGGERILEYC